MGLESFLKDFEVIEVLVLHLRVEFDFTERDIS